MTSPIGDTRNWDMAMGGFPNKPKFTATKPSEV